MREARVLAVLAVLLVGVARPAEAHLLGTGGGGLTQGFLHPMTGLDHLLAMLAVGAWATQIGGRARWLVPAAFATMVAVGGAFGMGAAPAGVVEIGIALSVVLLGGFVQFALRPGLALGMTLVGGFAVLHGYAHGAELPQAASPVLYATGLLFATALLHGIGMGIGLLLPRLYGSVALRAGGAAIAVAGLVLLAPL